MISLHINSELTMAVSNIIKTFTCLTILRIFSSARSTSVHHGLKEIQQQQATFLNFSNLEQSCLYTFIIHIHFHSVFNIKNRTRQYFCMNCIDNACMFKFLQDSSRFFRFQTQHVLYFLNTWGSMISNMTYAYILHTY